jgi:hypothetical protein
MPTPPINYRLLGRAARQRAEDAEARHQIEKLQGQRDARAVITIVLVSVAICAVTATFMFGLSRS